MSSGAEVRDRACRRCSKTTWHAHARFVCHCYGSRRSLVAALGAIATPPPPSSCLPAHQQPHCYCRSLAQLTRPPGRPSYSPATLDHYGTPSYHPLYIRSNPQTTPTPAYERRLYARQPPCVRAHPRSPRSSRSKQPSLLASQRRETLSPKLRQITSPSQHPPRQHKTPLLRFPIRQLSSPASVQSRPEPAPPASRPEEARRPLSGAQTAWSVDMSEMHCTYRTAQDSTVAETTTPTPAVLMSGAPAAGGEDSHSLLAAGVVRDETGAL